MNLYKVELAFTTFVLASDPSDAERIASSWEVLEDLNPECLDVCYAEQVSSIDQIPKVWLGCIPYGEKEDRTIEEILNKE